MVTSLLPEMEKKPAEFSVNAKLLALTVPPESVCVSVPIAAPEAAFVESVRLSMLIVMSHLRVIDNDPHTSFRVNCQFNNSCFAKNGTLLDRAVVAMGSLLVRSMPSPRPEHGPC